MCPAERPARPRRRRRRHARCLVLVTLVIAGCSSSSSATTATTASTGTSGRAAATSPGTTPAATTAGTDGTDGTDEPSSDTSGTAPGTHDAAPATDARGTGEVSSEAPVGWVNVTGNLAGTRSECGNTSYLSVRPDQDVVIAGVAQNGLWASTDPHGTTWTRLGTGAGSAVITNRASSFVYDPDHPGTFWESGIYNAGGIYRTTDGGTTFTQVGDDITHTEAVAVDLTDPQRATMLESRHEDSEVKLSTDGGKSWAVVSDSLQDIGYAMVPLIIDHDTFLLGSRNGDKSGIYRSTDRGASWHLAESGNFAGQPLVMHDGTILWVRNDSDVIASHDGGATWKVLSTQMLSSSALVDMGDGRLGAVMGDRLGTSSDGGVTWRRIGPSLPFQETGMAYSAARHAFYVWYFDCYFDKPDPVPADAIARWDVSADDAG